MDLRTLKTLTKEEHAKRRAEDDITPKRDGIPVSRMFWSAESLPIHHIARIRELEGKFTKKFMENVFIPIVEQNSIISLRALDWFVINYARRKSFSVINPDGRVVSVYSNYRMWLQFWHRPCFDAFRRGPRVFFSHAGEVYATTPGQANYIHWAAKLGILAYLTKHHKVIEADMNEHSKNKTKSNAFVGDAGSKCIVYHRPVTIKFRKSTKASGSNGGDLVEATQASPGRVDPRRTVPVGTEDHEPPAVHPMACE
jgi:hypothetical protein